MNVAADMLKFTTGCHLIWDSVAYSQGSIIQLTQMWEEKEKCVDEISFRAALTGNSGGEGIVYQKTAARCFAILCGNHRIAELLISF